VRFQGVVPGDSTFLFPGWKRDIGDEARPAFVSEVGIDPIQENDELVAEAHQKD
jgi:hypothetical protein